MSGAFACETDRDELHERACELSRDIVAHRECALVNYRAGLDGTAWMHECHAARKEEQVRWIADQCIWHASRVQLQQSGVMAS